MSGREWTYETADRHGQSDIPKQFAPLLTWGNLQVQQTENRLSLSLFMLLISRYLFAPQADNFDISLTKVSPCAQLLPRNSKMTKNNNIEASFCDFWPEIVRGKVPVRISSINHGTLWGNIFIVGSIYGQTCNTYQVANENICCACTKTFLLLHCKFSSLHCAKFEKN